MFQNQVNSYSAFLETLSYYVYLPVKECMTVMNAMTSELIQLLENSIM